jgi:lipoate-protein ligase A
VNRFRLLDAGPLSAAENMCLDEVLAVRAGRGVSPPTLRFLQFRPDAALVGFNQEIDRELRLDFCAEQGIEVNRRVTGGGALLFQESALGWELIAPLGTEPFTGGFEAALTRICLSAAAGLSRLGLTARFRPRNDIEVDGRKVSGTGGTVIQGGALFQGTVLVKNQIERFLRALRVPVEKLKKREIDSLMQRLAFLEDLLGGSLDMADLKDALAGQLSRDLGLSLYPDGLSADEEREMRDRLPYFQSDEWIHGRRRAEQRPAWLRSIQQSAGGLLRVHLWLDRTGRMVQKAFISGDFFCRPQRLMLDLEAALLGAKARPGDLHRLVSDYLADYPGEILGIEAEDVARAVADAARRTCLAEDFAEIEAADLFFVGMLPTDLHALDLRWLLLPYCSKPVDCDYRLVADCGLCGECQFSPMYELAEHLGLTPISVQSFEHLMEALAQVRAEGGAFVGSCCEAFYCKHQQEMDRSGARGVLINLDSTTCYDLGKGMEAYVGKFDHQTSMNTDLIEKVAKTILHT